MISHLSECSIDFLLKLFNRIFPEERMPISWKEAITPIPKPEKDPTKPENFRPICLTSCICLLEMVFFGLVWYLEKEQVFLQFQFGFRKMRVNNSCLFYTTNNLRECLHPRTWSVGGFLWFGKGMRYNMEAWHIMKLQKTVAMYFEKRTRNFHPHLF